MENDRAFAELLNDCLEAMESGEVAVEECLARHPQHAARLDDLLRLGDEVRRMPVPAPTPGMLAAGEERLLQAVRSQGAERPAAQKDQNLWAALSRRLVDPVVARVRSWPKWTVPALALSGGMALLFACLLVLTLGAGATRWAFRSQDATPEEPGAIAGYPPTGTPETDAAQSPAQTPTMGAAQSPVQAPDREATHVVFVPVVNGPLPSDRAMLRNIRGVVEFQADTVDPADGGPWAVAGDGQIVQAGQRVRTGALSGVQIAFYDGSVAYLGPDSEVSLDHLGRDPTDGARIVELTQWVGESDHDVAPAQGDTARYEVHTPSGTGKATGTSFHVLVVPGLMSRFSVNKGSVLVIHVDVTVVVVAGQLTTVPVNRPPSEPYFRVSGEGEVMEIGATWKIGGQVFATHDHTTIVGNPQVGDWVRVDGHLLPDGTRVADRILLLRRSPANRFTIVGRVEARGPAAWTVAGQEIAVDDATQIDENIEVGDRVRVDGVIGEGGALLAESIRLIQETGIPFSFVGVVQEISDASWKVSGVSIAVDAETVIEDALAIGDLVRVRGVYLEPEGGDRSSDGTWLARSIRRAGSQEQAFEFVGRVERIDPWVVSGIAIETRLWTEIKGPIKVGDRVKVEGRILPDGTWLADEIKAVTMRPPEQPEGLSFEFVGIVQSIDPWVVGGIPLTVDRRTEIKADAERPIEVGDRVKVEGRILPTGEWLATEIKPAEGRFGRGCMQFTSLVVRIEGGRLILKNGATISVEGVPIEGEIQVNSVILIVVCVDEEGRITVVSIIVLYQKEPVIIVRPTPAPPSQPPPPPSQPPPPPGGGSPIVVNENDQTQTFTCNGHSVTINGNNNTIRLFGSCGPVTIRGNNNWVSIRSATSVANTGNGNTIVGP